MKALTFVIVCNIIKLWGTYERLELFYDTKKSESAW